MPLYDRLEEVYIFESDGRVVRMIRNGGLVYILLSSYEASKYKVVPYYHIPSRTLELQVGV